MFDCEPYVGNTREQNERACVDTKTANCVKALQENIAVNFTHRKASETQAIGSMRDQCSFVTVGIKLICGLRANSQFRDDLGLMIPQELHFPGLRPSDRVRVQI